MMAAAHTMLLLLFLTSPLIWAQQGGADQTADQPASVQPTFTVGSTLVQVPVLVKSKHGGVVFSLAADDFLVTDNGVPQKPTIDPDTDSQPLALAIVVETGGLGVQHLADYGRLDTILDALIGDVEHRVAVIAFDSTPHLITPFTPGTFDAARALATLDKGDNGAAILDAIAFAVTQLRLQPMRYRRAILLFSETVDQGSLTNLDEALRLISDTNTAMYSFSFSSTRAAVSHEASKFSNNTPGPAHGCFSRQGADQEYDGHYSKQVLDCISQLAPPLRLATMSFLAARGALRTKTAESIAQLAGGESFHFRGAKDLKAGLITLSNDLPNYYVLSFRPTAPTPGLHALQVEIKGRPQLALESRREYWIEEEAAR
jgi:VWFA-related protein